MVYIFVQNLEYNRFSASSHMSVRFQSKSIQKQKRIKYFRERKSLKYFIELKIRIQQKEDEKRTKSWIRFQRNRFYYRKAEFNTFFVFLVLKIYLTFCKLIVAKLKRIKYSLKCHFCASSLISTNRAFTEGSASRIYKLLKSINANQKAFNKQNQHILYFRVQVSKH